MLLEGHVCDGCQRYFGKEVEQYILNKSPIAMWRVLLGITTKKGKLPKVDLSQPQGGGVLPASHPYHDDIAFEALDNGATLITKISEELANQVELEQRTQFRFVTTPRTLYMLGRFLCKVGLELICHVDPSEARSARFDRARRFARFGPWKPLWPMLSYECGSIEEQKTIKFDEQGAYVETECHSYWLGDVRGFRIFEFGIGTSRYVISLDEPFCPLLLEAEMANPLHRVLWYPM